MNTKYLRVGYLQSIDLDETQTKADGIKQMNTQVQESGCEAKYPEWMDEDCLFYRLYEFIDISDYPSDWTANDFGAEFDFESPVEGGEPKSFKIVSELPTGCKVAQVLVYAAA
jgi:hypothetical protein